MQESPFTENEQRHTHAHKQKQNSHEQTHTCTCMKARTRTNRQKDKHTQTYARTRTRTRTRHPAEREATYRSQFCHATLQAILALLSVKTVCRGRQRRKDEGTGGFRVGRSKHGTGEEEKTMTPAPHVSAHELRFRLQLALLVRRDIAQGFQCGAVQGLLRQHRIQHNRMQESKKMRQEESGNRGSKQGHMPQSESPWRPPACAHSPPAPPERSPACASRLPHAPEGPR